MMVVARSAESALAMRPTGEGFVELVHIAAPSWSCRGADELRERSKSGLLQELFKFCLAKPRRNHLPHSAAMKLTRLT